MAEKVKGLVRSGNIDTSARKPIDNHDGTASTVRSMSFNDGDHEVLVPTAFGDESDRVYTDEEAVKRYDRTGEHLGWFDKPEAATRYAEDLHNSEAAKGQYNPPVQRPVKEDIRARATRLRDVVTTNTDRKKTMSDETWMSKVGKYLGEKLPRGKGLELDDYAERRGQPDHEIKEGPQPEARSKEFPEWMNKNLPRQEGRQVDDYAERPGMPDHEVKDLTPAQPARPHQIIISNQSNGGDLQAGKPNVLIGKRVDPATADPKNLAQQGPGSRQPQAQADESYIEKVRQALARATSRRM